VVSAVALSIESATRVNGAEVWTELAVLEASSLHEELGSPWTASAVHAELFRAAS